MHKCRCIWSLNKKFATLEACVLLPVISGFTLCSRDFPERSCFFKTALHVEVRGNGSRGKCRDSSRSRLPRPVMRESGSSWWTRYNEKCMTMFECERVTLKCDIHTAIFRAAANKASLPKRILHDERAHRLCWRDKNTNEISTRRLYRLLI